MRTLRARKIGDKKSRRTIELEPYVLEQLKDLNFAAEYLSASIDSDGDPDEEFAVFFAALERIVRAQGVEGVAEKMDSNRDTIYKMFKHTNPTVKSLSRLLGALGLKISISVERPHATAKRA